MEKLLQGKLYIIHSTVNLQCYKFINYFITRQLTGQYKNRLRHLYEVSGQVPHLMVLQIGQRPDSNLYIKNKLLKAKKIGIQVTHQSFALNETTLSSSVKQFGNTTLEDDDGQLGHKRLATQESILKYIECANENPLVHGILLQLPVPSEYKHLGQLIRADKDVDG